MYLDAVFSMLATAAEARYAGLHWTFSPVIDLNYNFNNPITNIRAISVSQSEPSAWRPRTFRACRRVVVLPAPQSIFLVMDLMIGINTWARRSITYPSSRGHTPQHLGYAPVDDGTWGAAALRKSCLFNPLYRLDMCHFCAIVAKLQ